MSPRGRVLAGRRRATRLAARSPANGWKKALTSQSEDRGERATISHQRGRCGPGRGGRAGAGPCADVARRGHDRRPRGVRAPARRAAGAADRLGSPSAACRRARAARGGGIGLDAPDRPVGQGLPARRVVLPGDVEVVGVGRAAPLAAGFGDIAGVELARLAESVGLGSGSARAPGPARARGPAPAVTPARARPPARARRAPARAPEPRARAPAAQAQPPRRRAPRARGRAPAAEAPPRAAGTARLRPHARRGDAHAPDGRAHAPPGCDPTHGFPLHRTAALGGAP